MLCCGASSSVCCGLCWLMVGIAVMQLLALLLSGSAGSGAHFLGGCCPMCSSCRCCLARPMSTSQLGSLAKRGNFARSLGPKRLVLILFSGCDRLSLVVSSSSISAGSVRGRFVGGWSSHRLMCSSCPLPSVRLGLGLGGAGELVVVAGCTGCGCSARSLAGSPWCSGHVCQGRPQLHCHFLTKSDFLQLLHQNLVSRL